MQETLLIHSKCFTLILYYCSKICILSPFGYNFKQNQLKKSIISTLYCIVFVILTSYIHPVYSLSFYYETLGKNFPSKLEIYAGIFQGAFEYLIVIFIQCSYLWHRQQIIDYFNTKVAFSEKILSRQKEIHGKMYFAVLPIAVIVGCLIKFLLNFALFILVPDITTSTVTKVIIYFIPNFIVTFVGCTFIVEVISLRYFALQINNQLRSSLSIVYDLPKGASKARRMATACQVSDQVDELIVLHSELLALVAKYNSIQSFNLLLYYTNKFVEILVPVFFEYLVLRNLTKFVARAELTISVGLINLLTLIRTHPDSRML
uniref:Gustatory receptor n=1 Tax=Lutzomyia longipalpis TaxID=7200 RepID=A0A240SXV9_LUTLO